MSSNGSGKIRFGDFSLDTTKRVVWHLDQPVDLPLKAVDLLCLLVERRGDVVTKDEIWDRVWNGAFIEETNLTHNIYLLRKTFREYGADDIIKTVPRRGYRFVGDISESNGHQVVYERLTVTDTIIEDVTETKASTGAAWKVRYAVFAAIGLVAFAMIGSAAWQWGGVNTPTAKISSLAVLPFRSLNRTTGQEHEGISVAEILITRLSSIKERKVRPTSAVMRFADGDSMAAGRDLGVDAVLEGTIFRTNDQLRITTRLVRVADGSVVWSGEFQKPLNDELKIQNEMALHIVDILGANIREDERAAMLKSYTGSVDAFRLYQQGRFEWNKRNYSGMVEAQRLFRNAIEKDPDFALAYSGLADTLATGSVWSEASHAAATALRLDPTLAEAHATDGFIKMFGLWDWDGAEKAFQRSISQNSGYATAHHWYATLLAIRGRNEEARAEMQRAIDIDPLSPNFAADMGQLFYFSKDYAKARAFCEQALKLNPDFVFAHQYLHYIYLKSGDGSSAIEEMIAADKLNGIELGGRQSDDSPYFAGFRKAFGENGVRGFLEHRYSGKPTDPQAFYLYAMKHALLGENEAALSYLERAAEARTFLTAFIKADPIFENLHGDARFNRVLGKMSLDG